MNRSTAKKGLFILAIVLGSVLAAWKLPIHRGLDLQGGSSLILQVKAEDASPAQLSKVVEQTREILDRRINAFGLSETAIQSYGSQGDELLVQVPGISDVPRLEALLQSQGVLEWYAVSSGPYSSSDKALAQYGGTLSQDLKLISTKSSGSAEQSWYLLQTPPVIKDEPAGDGVHVGK
jgi:preprotein translocase subunit SecD